MLITNYVPNKEYILFSLHTLKVFSILFYVKDKIFTCFCATAMVSKAPLCEKEVVGIIESA